MRLHVEPVSGDDVAVLLVASGPELVKLTDALGLGAEMVQQSGGYERQAAVLKLLHEELIRQTS